jgi:hypothetical protein
MIQSSRLALVSLASLLFVASCASSPGDSSEATATTSADLGTTAEYVDMFDWLGDHGGSQDALVGAIQGLNNDFFNVCGDTFCGSDYSNLTPLSFTCSVSKTKGDIKMCRYNFAGSYQTVTGSTGTVVVHEKSFVCTVPAKGTAADLIAALTSTANSPLHNTLPGETSTVYDAIGGCLP